MKSNPFYKYLLELQRYRAGLVLAFILVILNAVFAFAGFGLFLKSVQVIFTHEGSIRHLVAESLTQPNITRWIGDCSAMASYVPEDKFSAFAVILGVICIMALIGAILRFAYDYIIIEVSYRTIRRIQTQCFKHLICSRWEATTAMGGGGYSQPLSFRLQLYQSRVRGGA